MNLKIPPWIDDNWDEGLNELEYNFATGCFKEAYWSKLVGHTLLIREEIYDEERLDKSYYSKNQTIKPIRVLEWRPLRINELETQFVNKGKNAWRIFSNPHTEEAKQNYIEMFDWHGHGCFCCEHEQWEVQTSKNFTRKHRND